MTTVLLRCLSSLMLVLQGFCGTPAWAADEFLSPEQAFRFEARTINAHLVEVIFTVADGHYLYRERFAFAAAPAEVKLGKPAIPTGQIQFDENFGRKLEIHRGRLVIRLPVESTIAAFKLTVTSQGCADAGLCYAPMQSSVRLYLGKASSNASE